ncbi:hypothetical protein BCV69DRAFT_141399 [Microstroma glucosiphilum]|uniref:Uncharacterized protein n=1 Tax=Pseudomicrostroma glucosiphilum TaxID=1684307 RepID=A0A316UGP6_9BASI|nr:hypothetical protein BCV69DRAFT_141399 [Pseudomicrostroma glucosiphilum]PWN22345.1 hypothetical protein BCV69DRAFT_141399 [Pseudomicrostroma glucosiphilum]
MYAFWCEDHAASTATGKAGCIVSNWTSLSGLMHYVCANHEKAKDYPLAGLCRLLEAVVLRHVASHEQKQLNVRLSRLVSRSAAADSSSSSSANGSTQPAASPASQASPQNGHETSAASPLLGLQRTQSASTLPTLSSLAGTKGGASAPTLDLTAILTDASSSLAKVVADEERCARLLSVARSALSPAVLSAEFPRTWEKCNRVGTLLDALATFRDLDPGKMARSAAKEDKEGGDPPQASWAWPLDAGATGAAVLVPHLVNFARALLREGSARRDVPFTLAADLP